MININEVKANCKERRVLYLSDLKETASKNKWHISDTCIKYAGILNSKKGQSLSTDDIITIAMDIFQNNHLQEESFSFIIHEVGNACTIFFE